MGYEKDFDVAEQMIKSFIKKFIKQIYLKPTTVICVPSVQQKMSKEDN